MKRITLNVAGSLLAFICGLATASSWNHHEHTIRYDEPAVKVIERCTTTTEVPVPPAESSIHTETAYREIAFGPELRILPEEVNLKSELLRYEIDVHYPQISGSDNVSIRKLNQTIKERAEAEYKTWMNPSKQDLQYYKATYPGVFNTVDLDYQIFLGTDSLLSIYFVGYSYGIGAAHSVQFSYVINYDVKSHKQLKLSDVFKRDVNYLEFIAQYCTGVLLQNPGLTQTLDRKAEMFESWNITPYGVRFHFDACKISACSVGEQSVEISFADLRPMLSQTMLDRLAYR
jgi:Deacetylase PdaC